VSEERSWNEIVLRAMKNLGADVRPVALKDIYSAARELAPSMCNDENVYKLTYRGRTSIEARWRKDVRGALLRLKRKGLVVREGKGLWRLAKTSQT
jgi:hypothetical protein